MPESSKSQAAAEEPTISPAELKKRAKAEKQARRAAQKEQREDGAPDTAAEKGGAAAPANGAPKGAKEEPSKQQSQKSKGQQQKQGGGQAGPSQQATQHRRTGSQGGRPTTPTTPAATAQMPIRSMPVVAQQQQQQQQQQQTLQKGGPRQRNAKKTAGNQVELFSHLYTQPRRQTVDGAPKDVHPSVLALGFKMSSYEICGSSARCVAMLLAFKDAIQAYTTPAGTSLARHLTSHYLSPQIDFLKSCRPISESMGNAIRWLKKLIAEIDPSHPEQEAKDFLCDNMDKFIQERITVTDRAISDSASRQIKDGSVVLTFAKSSIVERTILRAHDQGRAFRVIVIDSRPLFEGKHLATSLMRAGLEVEYLPFSGIAHAVKEATLVFLGAHSMLSNGRLQSRIGTASVAMQAHKAALPIIVCCESVKFSGKVGLDSIVLNEVAPSEELLLPAPSSSPSSLPSSTTPGKPEGEEAGGIPKEKALQDWREIPNLQILNLMYDVTPAEYISMIICEYGSLPPSSVPVVHRLANEGGV